MFKTERVGCLLYTFAGHGDDTENKELKLVFRVYGIKQPLAAEISPKLADRLFRETEGAWFPVEEMTKSAFSNIQVENQNVTFYSLPEKQLIQEDEALVLGAFISNLRAAKVTAQSIDFFLEFDMVIPMNFHTMRLVEQYYKSMCFLTMVPVQPQLEGVKVTVTVTPEQRELEESLNAAAATSDPPAEEGKAARRGRRGSGKSAAAGEKPE